MRAISTRSPTCGAISESAESSSRYIFTASLIARAADSAGDAGDGSADSVMFESTYFVAPAGIAVVPVVAAGDGADRWMHPMTVSRASESPVRALGGT